MKAEKPLVLIHQKTRQRYPLRGDLVIGRSTGDLIFDHDPKLSGKHCLIRPTEAGFAIYDLKSRTGVYINGTPLPPGKACILKDGAEIAVGDQTFMVTEDNGKIAHPAMTREGHDSDAIPIKGVLFGMALLVVAATGYVFFRLPAPSAKPQDTASHSAASVAEIPALDRIEAEMREAVARFQALTEAVKKNETSERQTLAYLREDLIPRFSKVNNLLKSTPAPKLDQAREVERQRRLAGALLGQVTAMAKYIESKDQRYARELGEYNRQVQVINDEIQRDSRQPSSSN